MDILMNSSEMLFVVTIILAALVVGSLGLYAHKKEQNEKKNSLEK